MKFRGQIYFVVFLITIVAPTVLAQISAEKDLPKSRVASLPVPNLLPLKTDPKAAGGLLNPAANLNTSAIEERKPAAVKAAQDSFRAGVASLNAGRYKEAIASLEVTRQLAPSSSAVYTELGNAYLGLAEYENSIKAFERAVSLGSTSLETRRRLGLSKIGKNRAGHPSFARGHAARTGKCHQSLPAGICLR